MVMFGSGTILIRPLQEIEEYEEDFGAVAIVVLML
jgi:hypothetical protein